MAGRGGERKGEGVWVVRLGTQESGALANVPMAREANHLLLEFAGDPRLAVKVQDMEGGGERVGAGGEVGACVGLGVGE